MALEGPSKLTRRSDSIIVSSGPDSHFHTRVNNTESQFLIGKTETSMSVSWDCGNEMKWNFWRFSKSLQKGPLKVWPKMCPVHYGNQIVNVGSYRDLSSNPGPPHDCFTRHKSFHCLSLSCFIWELEMLVLPPCWGCCEGQCNDLCDIPRPMKSAERLSFHSECEQRSPAFPLTQGLLEGWAHNFLISLCAELNTMLGMERYSDVSAVEFTSTSFTHSRCFCTAEKRMDSDLLQL